MSCFFGLPGRWIGRSRPQKTVTVAVLGLDNAGKTTIISCLRGEPDGDTAPSIGFSTQAVELDGFKVQLYDVGGGKHIRRIWKTYYADLHGVIFVVDAAARSRFEEARQVLAQLAADKFVQGKPLVVLANKQDLPGAAPPHEVALELGLTELRRVQYNIMACTALRGAPGRHEVDTAITTGLKWLLGCVELRYPQLMQRVQQESEQIRQQEKRLRQERLERAQRLKEGLKEQQQQQHQEQKATRPAALSTPVTPFESSSRSCSGSDAKASLVCQGNAEQLEKWALPGAQLRSNNRGSIDSIRTSSELVGGHTLAGALGSSQGLQSMLQATRSLEQQAPCDIRHSARGTTLISVLEAAATSRSRSPSNSQVLHSSGQAGAAASSSLSSGSSLQASPGQGHCADAGCGVQVLQGTRRSSASLAEQTSMARKLSLGESFTNSSSSSNIRAPLVAGDAPLASQPSGRLPPIAAAVRASLGHVDSTIRASLGHVDSTMTSSDRPGVAGQLAAGPQPSGSLRDSLFQRTMSGGSQVAPMIMSGSFSAPGSAEGQAMAAAVVTQAGDAVKAAQASSSEHVADASRQPALMTALPGSGRRVSKALPMLG